MSDIKVSYTKVVEVTTNLHSTTHDTLPKLSAVKQAVDGLLADGGGLWLTSSSPTLQEKYEAFNKSVTEAINSIPQWANQFDNIVTQLKDLDRSIVESAGSGDSKS
ncbi:hypothetical protein [Kineosporia sp. NBRC 101731]|uniref:hypothetical protein n=1 Tax=Kineosporia sp. NBRC 101731 TaxID=3032199 RepID=UPI0024A01704|nr:hypothetical protein [Kineosporia sp. NBRC 101731]GLY29871.1 hypothetical protein Kisp02_32360 [Kineosporia sp. NBRC 101731]